MSAGRGGFTLIEVLVALVVTGLVTAAAQATLGVAVDARNRSRVERTAVISGATARTTLEQWLYAAAVGEGLPPFVGTSGDGEYPRDELRFAVRDAGTLYPGPHRIHLWVDRDPGTAPEGLLAEIAALRGRGGRPDTLALAPAALGLSIRYRAHILGQLRSQPVWDSDKQVPRGVELSLLAPPADPRHGGLAPIWRPPLVVRIAQGR